MRFPKAIDVENALLDGLSSLGITYARVRFSAERTCPICGYTGRFRPYGRYNVRPDSECKRCGSMERQRLLCLAIQGQGWAAGSQDIVHFAPEDIIARVARPLAKSYVTADLFDARADERWNIEEIDCPDARFDVVLCSHVLEHVDTAKALAELYRILRPGGVAMLMVPICEGLDETYVDPAITDPRARWLHFHQDDHMRIIGRDFRRLITEAGFDLSEIVASGSEAAKYGLVVGERVFLARRPSEGLTP